MITLASGIVLSHRLDIIWYKYVEKLLTCTKYCRVFPRGPSLEYKRQGLTTAYPWFKACPGSFQSSHGRKYPDPKSNWPLHPDKPGCITSCRGGDTNRDFFLPFFWIFVPNCLEVFCYFLRYWLEN